MNQIVENTGQLNRCLWQVRLTTTIPRWILRLLKTFKQFILHHCHYLAAWNYLNAIVVGNTFLIYRIKNFIDIFDPLFIQDLLIEFFSEVFYFLGCNFLFDLLDMLIGYGNSQIFVLLSLSPGHHHEEALHHFILNFKLLAIFINPKCWLHQNSSRESTFSILFLPGFINELFINNLLNWVIPFDFLMF